MIGVGPLPCLPSDSARSWSYHQPSASSFFDQTARTRVGLAEFRRHQVVDGRVLQDRVALERLGQEPLRHRRGAEQQGLHVEPDDRGRQQADGEKTENRPPTPSGMVRMSFVGEPVLLTQLAELAGRARDRDDSTCAIRPGCYRRTGRASLADDAVGRRPSRACRRDLLMTTAPQRSSRTAGSTQVFSSRSSRSWRASLSTLLPSK